MTILDDKGLPAQQGNICDINNKKSLIVISEVSLEKGKKALALDVMEKELTPIDILQIIKIVADQVGPAAMKQMQEQGSAIQTVPASTLEDVKRRVKLDR